MPPSTNANNLCPGLQAQKSAVGSCACTRRQQNGVNEEPTTVEPWARFLQMCQYSSGRREVVVALRSASVIIQNFTPVLSVYADSRRNPWTRPNSFSAMSSSESSPQSPGRCRCRNVSGDSPGALNASRTPEVGPTCPG